MTSENAETPPFVGPDRKIDRAHHHFYQLEDLLANYRSKVNLHYIPISHEPNSWKVSIRKPPIECMLILGDLAHNLKSALDILLCDISRLRRRGCSVKSIKYPFAKDAGTFERMLTGPLKDNAWRKLGSDLVTAISETKPYAAGNDDLYAMREFNNTDKHELLQPFTVMASIQVTSTAMLDYHSRKINEGLGITEYETDMWGPMAGPFVALADGETIHREAGMPPPHIDLTPEKFTPIIRFPQDHPVLGGMELADFARRAINATTAVVDQLRQFRSIQSVDINPQGC